MKNVLCALFAVWTVTGIFELSGIRYDVSTAWAATGGILMVAMLCLMFTHGGRQ